MNYLSAIYLIIAFTIIIYLKGWRKGAFLGIITLAFMILLSWAEDVLFNDYTIITVIVFLILSFLYQYIEKYIKSNYINKARAEIPNPRRREFQISHLNIKTPIIHFLGKKIIAAKDCNGKKRMFLIKVMHNGLNNLEITMAL